MSDGAVVLASVRSTRGATPRKAGSRMLVTATDTEFSVGGGAAEARVIDAARQLLRGNQDRADLAIDLTGKPGAAGVCGGAMQIVLRRWHDAADHVRAADIAAQLAAGQPVSLAAADLGGGDALVLPNPRLLIVGGGHCSLALHDLARHLDFDLCVFDPRPDCFGAGQFPGARTLHGGFDALDAAFDTRRDIYAVLLNRDYAGDVATLRVLQHRTTAYLGMMGSRKRIAEVRAAFPPDAAVLERLHAPVGLAIGAHTPHEIAVSILAELIARRYATA
nr:XdhC/CoxI family protein [Chiayiivirga flava]